MPNEYAISESPIQPKFQEIDKKTTGVLGYITAPVYLPNAAALSGDERNAGIIRIDVEFQVVEHLTCGYLLERDALKAYKAVIDKDAGQIIFPLFDPSFRVPITEGDRYNRSKLDLRIFATRTIRINPGRHLWVPVQMNSEDWDDDMELIASPLRKRSVPEDTYLADAYSLVSKRTSHLYFINPSNRI